MADTAAQGMTMPHRAGRRGAKTAAVAATTKGTKLAIMLFVAAALLPLQPEIAGIKLIPYRAYLIAVTFPFFAALLRRSSGGFNAADGLMMFVSFWVFITFVYHHGASRIPYSFMSSIEFFCAYLVGRILIRDLAALRFFLTCFFVGLLVLLPPAIYENRTGQNMWLDFFRKFFPVNSHFIDKRDGGYRAQSVMAHPIHYGIMGSLFVGMAYYLYPLGKGGWQRLALCAGTIFCAQSSAPILATGVQIGTIVWGKITGNKWGLLASIVAFLYISLSILSNRGPIILIIEYLTLNPRTAWWRVHVWNFGTENVMQNPIMGLGLNDWVRPHWLAETVDNFWLLIAMRHGLPAITALLLCLGLIVTWVVRKKGLSPEMQRARTGYMISFIGFFFAFVTVHSWGQMLVFSMFFVGAGSLFYAAEPQAEDDESAIAEEDAVPQSRFSRFPRKPPARLRQSQA